MKSLMALILILVMQIVSTVTLAQEDSSAVDRRQSSSPQKTKRPKKEKEVVTTRVIGCADNVGGPLCVSLRSLKNSFLWYCTGSPCYSVWQNQVEQLKYFSNTFDWANKQLTGKYILSREILDEARQAADYICRSTAEGDPGIIANLVMNENNALLRLELVQHKAGDSSPRTCTRTTR